MGCAIYLPMICAWLKGPVLIDSSWPYVTRCRSKLSAVSLGDPVASDATAKMRMRQTKTKTIRFALILFIFLMALKKHDFSSFFEEGSWQLHCPSSRSECNHEISLLSLLQNATVMTFTLTVSFLFSSVPLHTSTSYIWLY